MSAVGDEPYFAAAAVEQTLGRSTDVDACVALAGEMAGLIGQAQQFIHNAQGEIACQAGCHFCCHLHVLIYPHEAIALHRYLGSKLAADKAQRVRERLIANAAQLRQSQLPFAAAPRSPCAFLLDGQCSVYEVRPAACASYHSLSRPACEADHQSAGARSQHAPEAGGSQAQGTAGAPGGAGGGIPVSQALRHVASALREGLERGLNTLGLPATQVELQTAVAALLQAPALIGRWRSGREWPHDARGVVAVKK